MERKNDVLLVKPSSFIAFLKTFPSNTHVRRVYWTLSYRHLVERSSNQCYFMPVRHEKQNAMDAQNVWRYSCCVPMSYFQTWLSQNALLRDSCIQSRENSDHMDNPTALKLGRNVLYVIAQMMSEWFFDILKNVHFLDLRVLKYTLFNEFSKRYVNISKTIPFIKNRLWHHFSWSFGIILRQTECKYLWWCLLRIFLKFHTIS